MEPGVGLVTVGQSLFGGFKKVDKVWISLKQISGVFEKYIACRGRGRREEKIN